MQLSPLAVACLERDAWKQVENISRVGRNKRVHAYAVKKVSAYSDIIARIAEQEVSDYELKELEKAKKAEEAVRGKGKGKDEEEGEEEDTPMLQAILDEKKEEAENSFAFF